MKKLSIIALAMLFSCMDQEEALPTNPTDSQTIDPVYEYMIKLGFHSRDIVEYPDYYVAEGDIMFLKDMVVPEENAKQNQYWTGTRVAFNSRHIRIRVDPSMSSMISEINAAIAEWNAVIDEGSGIRFTIVQGAYDILMKNVNLDGATCGMAGFPNSGAPGWYVYIDKSYISGNSFNQRKRTITHELGHTIGFRHTNWSSRGESSAVSVPGVGGTDSNSLMNGGQCNSGSTILSPKDRNATVALYPTADPWGLWNNTTSLGYSFYWLPPLDTQFGSVVTYEMRYTRYDTLGNVVESGTQFTTGTSYALPFFPGYYQGSCKLEVLAWYNVTSSNWVALTIPL